ncbi:hypothetical protein WIW50_04765 [Flavobacteriaceae bacterium 3-367]
MLLNRLVKFLNERKSKSYPYSDILHLWEDDYAMIELVPSENLEFAIQEGQRINEFGEKHRDGLGFSDITEIAELKVKVLDRQLGFSKVLGIFQSTELPPITKVVHQNAGLKKSEDPPFGFGSQKFGILLEENDGHLNRIWLTGSTKNEEIKNHMKLGLRKFCKYFDFIAVNWYQGTVFDLREENQLLEFVNKVC